MVSNFMMIKVQHLTMLLTCFLGQNGFSQNHLPLVDNKLATQHEIGEGDYSPHSNGLYNLNHSMDFTGISISPEEFQKNLPTNPYQALIYIVKEMNRAQELESGKNIEFRISTVDSMDTLNGIEFSPYFEKNRLVFNVKLLKPLIENPIYVLEVMARIEYMTQAQINFNIKKLHELSYKVHHSYFHKHHLQFVVDHTKTITMKYHSEIINSAIKYLGISSVPNSSFTNTLTWAEILINSSMESAYAQKELDRIELALAKNAMNSYLNFNFTKDLSEQDRIRYLQEIAKYKGLKLNINLSPNEMASEYFNLVINYQNKKLVDSTAKAQKQYLIEKSYFNRQDIKNQKDYLENQSKLLNELVKENNREGVAQLLEAYLPFDIMEPFEKKLWQEWIEAIRHPKVENQILLFRGLDPENDKPQVAIDENKQIKGHGFFSVLLNRNQGSYTRRLRSLSTMRYRFMNPENKEFAPTEISPKMTTLMTNHAANPSGSPMLSFTTNSQVAADFGLQAGVIAVKIDSRRVLPNVMSGFKNEFELLVPLIVFPDEVILYEKPLNRKVDGNTHIGIDTVLFQQKLETILGKGYEQQFEKSFKSLIIKSYTMFERANPLQLNSNILRCEKLLK